MARHWREADGRPTVGALRQPSVSVGKYAPPDSKSFAGRADSLRGDWPDSPGQDWEPFIQETDIQERAAMRFALFCCVSPFILAVIIWAILKFFS